MTGMRESDAAESGLGERQDLTIARLRAGHRGNQADAEAGGDQRKNTGELIAFENGMKFDLGASAGGENVLAETMAVLEQKHAFVTHFGEIDRGCLRQTMIAADGDH